jgi:hypothetical protein
MCDTVVRTTVFIGGKKIKLSRVDHCMKLGGGRGLSIKMTNWEI